MTNDEAEQFLRISGIVPTQTLVELIKSVWKQAFLAGYHHESI